jgi:hypothetical protein
MYANTSSTSLFGLVERDTNDDGFIDADSQLA